MPLYGFQCPKCEKKTEELMSYSDLKKHKATCGECGIALDRDYTAHGDVGIVGCETAKTFWSQSLAISPSQVQEHRELFPDVLVDSEGLVGFTSVKQREKYLEKIGMEKVPARTKATGERIY